METFYLIAGMALVTFTLRFILLPLSGKADLSAGMRRALRYVPPVVLTAIIVPSVLVPDGETIQVTWRNAYLAGALATVVIAGLSKNLLVTIIGGMAFFALWQWLVQMYPLL